MKVSIDNKKLRLKVRLEVLQDHKKALNREFYYLERNFLTYEKQQRKLVRQTYIKLKSENSAKIKEVHKELRELKNVYDKAH